MVGCAFTWAGLPTHLGGGPYLEIDYVASWPQRCTLVWRAEGRPTSKGRALWMHMMLCSKIAPNCALGSDSNEMLSARSTVTALFGCVYTSTERIETANILSLLH